jgi:hypothetical protein
MADQASKLAENPCRAAQVAQLMASRGFPDQDIISVSRIGAMRAAQQAKSDAAVMERDREAGR